MISNTSPRNGQIGRKCLNRGKYKLTFMGNLTSRLLPLKRAHAFPKHNYEKPYTKSKMLFYIPLQSSNVDDPAKATNIFQVFNTFV